MDVYNYLVDHIGVSAFDAFLIIIIFILAREKYIELAEKAECNSKRISRLEKTLYRAGINLLPMEDD